MELLYSCIIACSMYSKIPMPMVAWSGARMKYVMCFFPITGVIEGAVLGLWLWMALHVLSCSVMMTALWASAIPILITGGIHMDGLLDCMDAIHSYGDRKKKLEIMKDPHLGAFAVIGLAAYLMIYVGVMYELASLLQDWQPGRSGIWPYLLPAFLMAAERAFSGLSVICFPPAKKDGLAASFGKAAQTRRTTWALLGWLAALLAVFRLTAGASAAALRCALLLLLALLLCFLAYRRRALREFGGVTGDLAGAFLQLEELAGLIVCTVCLKWLGGAV